MTIYHLNLSYDTPLPHAIVPNVLTIGNFDGVHRGHQAMLQQLHDSASLLGIASAVMIFEPQPREYFATLKGDVTLAPARLTSVTEKISLLQRYGTQLIIIATFDERFRSLSAHEFATLLAEHLNVKALVLGDDFRFGHDRTGDSDFLRQFGLPVTTLQTITDKVARTTTDETKAGSTLTDNTNNAKNTPKAIAHSTDHTSIHHTSIHHTKDDTVDTRISSTRIRECLAVGDIATATHLLGHDYTITGEVLHGDKIGRTLDFPTANINLGRLNPPLHGIFAVDVVMLDTNGDVIAHGFQGVADKGVHDKSVRDANLDTNTNTPAKTCDNGVTGLRPHSLFGAVNIGTRPSVDKPHDWRLEVHFPKFAGDLYGKVLNVRFLHYLHGERDYQNLEALKAGIQQDVVDLLKWRDAQLD